MRFIAWTSKKKKKTVWECRRERLVGLSFVSCYCRAVFPRSRSYLPYLYSYTGCISIQRRIKCNNVGRFLLFLSKGCILSTLIVFGRYFSGTGLVDLPVLSGPHLINAIKRTEIDNYLLLQLNVCPVATNNMDTVRSPTNACKYCLITHP